jgi:hypothetical protein
VDHSTENALQSFENLTTGNKFNTANRLNAMRIDQAFGICEDRPERSGFSLYIDAHLQQQPQTRQQYR